MIINTYFSHSIDCIMNEDSHHKKLANELFQAMNTGEFSQFQDRLSEEVAFDFPGTVMLKGKKKVLLFLRVLLRKYKELTFTVTDIVEAGNTLVAVWTNEGINSQDKTYHNSGLTLMYFNDEGQITFLSDYFKDTSFVND